MQGHAAPGVTGQRLASRASPSPPARQARSPRRARRARSRRPGPGRGLLRGGPAPRGHLPGVTLASAWGSGDATRDPRGAGVPGALLPEGSAALVKAPPGHSGIYVFGARGRLAWTPSSARPLSFPSSSAVGLRSPPPVHGVAPRYLIILLRLSPAPAELLRLAHRFPVGHGAGSERARRIGSLSATIRGEREESRARGGQGRDVGRRLQVCERAECDCVGSPGATSPTGALPTVRRAAARAPFKGVGGGRGGAAPGQLRPRVSTRAYSRLNACTPLPARAEFSFQGAPSLAVLTWLSRSPALRSSGIRVHGQVQRE